MRKIDVFPTHIEITPYKKGESKTLEDICSTKWNPVTHRKVPMGMWIPKGTNTLFVPRGVSVTYIAQLFNATPNYVNSWSVAQMKYKYKVSWKPKNDDQLDAINFLLQRNSYGRTYPQIALNVEPGFGKTYCALVAALERGERTLIICPKENVKQQWIKTLKEMTGMTSDRIVDIKGSDVIESMLRKKVDCDVIISLHASLRNYEKAKGTQKMVDFLKHIECGTKIIDECHLEFAQIIHFDMLANIPNNIYLSATMTRSDPLEQALFRTVFASTPRFGEELDTAKNVVYNFVHYNSYPSEMEQAAIKTKYGFSSYKFSDYAFYRDDNACMIRTMYKVFERIANLSGRILIVVPKIEYCEELLQALKNNYFEQDIRTVHSSHSKEYNETAKKEAEIIISTISSLGTGSDIAKLRVIIIMEPYSSTVIAKQLSGRLRPYGKGQLSYVYDLTDIGFEAMNTLEKEKLGL